MKQPELTLRSPINPYLVMLTAIVLPGMGQVLNHAAKRGMTMLFFMILLGFVTNQLASPDVSIIGKFAGGIFIYALSVMDAYMRARYRWEYYKKQFI